MGILDFLKGEFIDVIHWTDDTRDTMVWRFEREGHAIKYGAKLTVREGQAAAFVHEGVLADVFPPGLYMLETNNLPILTTLQHWDHGFNSPFKSEIYFVNTTRFTDQKWGTRNPIIARDKEFGPIRLRAFGTYTMRVADPGKFMTEIVGTDGEFTSDEIADQVRSIIVQEFGRVIASAGIPVLDMAANTADLGRIVVKAIEPAVAAYGLSVPEFYIENISLPEAVEAALDKRTAMGVVGNLDDYMKLNAAEALGRGGDGGAMGAAVGAGVGMGMGAAIGGGGPWGRGAGASPPPAPAAPPPLPGGRVWHVAQGGEQTGPFAEADLPAMIADGRLTRDTLVWTPGMVAWTRAGDLPDLSARLTDTPPPLPR